jgi:hypothetical protein
MWYLSRNYIFPPNDVCSILTRLSHFSFKQRTRTVLKMWFVIWMCVYAFSRCCRVIAREEPRAEAVLLLLLWLTVWDLFIIIVLGQTGSLFSCDCLSVCTRKRTLLPISSSALAGLTSSIWRTRPDQTERQNVCSFSYEEHGEERRETNRPVQWRSALLSQRKYEQNWAPSIILYVFFNWSTWWGPPLWSSG